ncbi:MAG: low specificity L-threonine aldolase [Clostridia bacterium]|nr:low specificity L-threonine aldolase [Clostridia bacterium]
MIHFESDYLEGAHPRILERLMATNMEQTIGYGEDEHCARARALIAAECGLEPEAVHFLVGGTQTNATVIDAILRPWQGAVCAATGHIAVHESGAVEANGHKVLPIAGENGKLSAEQVRACHAAHWNDVTHEHMVQPGLVYISHPTENGEIYTKAELTALKAACDELDLPLFIDGARLGYGLAAPGADVTLRDIAALCDVFYIGGTKVGALFGEAVVIVNPALRRDFRYMMKRHGAMLAKGRLLGIQFETLFEDGLYLAVARHAVDMAMRLRQAFADRGIPFYAESVTNQQFPILTRAQQAQLGRKYAYSHWAAVDGDHDAVRFCTSWATTEENLGALIEDITRLT